MATPSIWALHYQLWGLVYFPISMYLHMTVSSSHYDYGSCLRKSPRKWKKSPLFQVGKEGAVETRIEAEKNLCPFPIRLLYKLIEWWYVIIRRNLVGNLHLQCRNVTHSITDRYFYCSSEYHQYCINNTALLWRSFQYYPVIITFLFILCRKVIPLNFSQLFPNSDSLPQLQALMLGSSCLTLM